MHKRIILVGPTASGKNFIKEQFGKKGFKLDVSYTTRKPREGEVNGVDYNFISREDFQDMIMWNKLYEYVQYGEDFYGTGLEEWNSCDVFIMETVGISHIKPEDRNECLVIFVNTQRITRIHRMYDRGWDVDKVAKRLKIDHIFESFTDFDIQIKSE